MEKNQVLQKPGNRFMEAWKRNPLISTGVVLILMVIIQTGIMIYNFGSGSIGELLLSLLTNWLNILRNNAPVGIIALGMTFAIISGGIDLSVGSTLVAVGAASRSLGAGDPGHNRRQQHSSDAC